LALRKYLGEHRMGEFSLAHDSCVGAVFPQVPGFGVGMNTCDDVKPRVR
jgi:hypothetical protein